MSSFDIGLIGVAALVLLVFMGMRVFFAAALVGTLGLVAIIGWESGLGMVGTIPHSKAVTYTLSVLPMFILIGFLAFHAGITEALFDAGRKWLGWLPGGLAVATVWQQQALRRSLVPVRPRRRCLPAWLCPTC